MCRELKEETGLIVPRDFRLAKVKAYEYKDDNHNNHTNVLYTADLPMAYLLAEDSYRTKEHARHMGHKLRRMRHNGEQIPAFFDCPVAANTHAEIVDGGARVPSYNCFSFAEIMPVLEVQNFLDIDAVDGLNYEDMVFGSHMLKQRCGRRPLPYTTTPRLQKSWTPFHRGSQGSSLA